MTMEIRCLQSASCNQFITDLFCNQLLAKSQFSVILGAKCLFELFQGYFWSKLVILNQIIHKCPFKLMKWPVCNVFYDHSHRIERFWTFILEFFPILSTFGYFSQESKLAWSLCFRKFQFQTRVFPWLTF